MKKTLKLISIMLSLILALSFTACGGGSSNEEEQTDDGQNPAMNFVGDYVNNRASIFIGAEGADGINATVTWATSAAENTVWTMSGTFDSENLQFEYSDCIKTDYVYGTDGEIDDMNEVYTDGHGIIKFTDGEELSLTWQDDEEHIADGTVFTYNSAVPAEGEGIGMANPWQTADSLQAAAEGAGLDGFEIVDTEISLGKVVPEEYRYMDGIAEAVIPIGAVDMTIRKGLASAASEGDVSGDYNSYNNEWTQNIKGLEVKCYGNREGEATKTIWMVDDTCYSITAYGAGGDDDFGLSADDLSTLINGIQ